MSCKKNKIALICANGGHLTEMEQLRPAYNDYPTFYITYRGSDSSDLPHAYFYTDYKSVLVKMFIQLCTVWAILLKERPKLILTTGGAISIPASIYGRLFGMHIVYLDCGTKVFEKSGTGKWMIFLADIFLTQWPGMVKKYAKNAQYWGSLI